MGMLWSWKRLVNLTNIKPLVIIDYLDVIHAAHLPISYPFTNCIFSEYLIYCFTLQSFPRVIRVRGICILYAIDCKYIIIIYVQTLYAYIRTCVYIHYDHINFVGAISLSMHHYICRLSTCTKTHSYL